MLIGQLNVNFALMWEPVIELIETHVRGLGTPENRDNATVFWEFFAGHVLRTASESARNVVAIDSSTKANDPFYDHWCPPESVPFDDDRPQPHVRPPDAQSQK